jgi:hypothetical protein
MLPRALLAASLVAAAGCGGPPAQATTPAPPGPTGCERVGDHLVGLLTAGFGDAPAEERPTEAIDRLTRVVIDLCTRGGWSADAQQCFLTVGPPAEDVATWDRCAGLLTVEQRDALPGAIDAAFGPPPGGE